MEFESKCRLAPAHTVLDHSSRLWHFPMDSKATFTPLISSKKNLRKLKTKLDIDGSVSHRHCDCLSFSVVQNDTHRISHRPSIRYEIFMHFKFLDSFFSGLFCSRTTHSLEVWLQLLLLCCQMPGTRALTIHSHSIFYSSAYWPAYTKKTKIANANEIYSSRCHSFNHFGYKLLSFSVPGKATRTHTRPAASNSLSATINYAMRIFFMSQFAQRECETGAHSTNVYLRFIDVTDLCLFSVLFLV